MNSIFLSIFFVFLISSFHAYAQIPTYENGQQYCERIKSMREVEIENGFIDVPIDYSRAEKGKTQIYYHSTKKINKSWPTLIYFTGGPGGAAHFQGWKNWETLQKLDINIVHFDQRGIACSRPLTEAMYKDPDYYSIENTARDADEIRKYLGLNKVSAYGVSYGTAPATVYAHLFKHVTTSLILEGIVYSGFDFDGLSLNSGIYHIQKLFNSLPQATQEKWIRLVRENKVEGFWFPSVVKSVLMSAGMMAWDSFKEALIESMKIEDDEKALQALGIQMKKPSEIKTQGVVNAILPTDEVVNGIIFCKEMGASVPNIATVLTMDGGKIIPMKIGDQLYNSYASSTCRMYKLENSGASKYVASNYPVSVPVYYFQGTLDSATPPKGAVYHYKKVPKKEAYLILFKNQGHTPTATALVMGLTEASPFKQVTDTTQNLFYTAVLGQPWTKAVVNKLNLYTYQTTFTAK